MTSAYYSYVKLIRKFGLHILLIFIVIIWMVPIYTVITTAIKSKYDFYQSVSLFSLPSKIEWANFPKSFNEGRLAMYMRNGIIICVLKVPLGIFIEALAAFALARLRIKNATGIFIIFLIGMMLPMQAALVPINIIYSRLHLLNTYFGLFYVYVGFGISLGILILRGFFRTIPREIDDAALIDGCNKWRLFWNIILPISKAAVATLVITDFLSTWNEYILALVIINDNNKKTVPVGLMTFMGEYGTDFTMLCAGVLISIIPVFIIYIVFQRYFVEGVSGAVKA